MNQFQRTIDNIRCSSGKHLPIHEFRPAHGTLINRTKANLMKIDIVAGTRIPDTVR
jgi:hypothetical protein